MQLHLQTMKLRLNPSAAHTWTECTAQPHYIRQFADRLPPNDTDFNREGTVAHSVVEHLFKEDTVPYEIKGFKKEMGTHAQGFRDYCFKLLGSPDLLWWSERKVSLFYAPESNGYIDFSGIRADGGVLIADFKYGQGVAVTAEENLQLAIYAESLIRAQCPDLDRYVEITMAIYQPRVRQGEPETTWTLPYGELLQFLEERVVIPAADIRGMTLRFSPSTDVCRFCPAAGFCGMLGYEPDFPYSGSMRAANLLDDTPLAPLRKGLPARLQRAAELPMDVIAKLVLRKKDIAKLLEDAEKYASSLLADGKPVQGLKLVQGRGAHRAWRNEDDVRALLLEHLPLSEIVTEKLVSPAQADKFEHDLPKERWEQLKLLTYKPEGGPVLAAENDPRPAYGRRDVSDLLEDEKEDWV